MKALRAKLNQPDAWMREGLAEVAMLVPNGTNSGKWTLKPEYRNMVGKNVDELEATLDNMRVPEGGEGSGEMPIEIDDDDEDDDDEVEMVDVL